MTTNVNYWALLVPGAGTVVAAIVTGFLASWVQHRRSLASEKTAWERERDMRLREEVRTCASDYLKARADLIALVTGWFARLSELPHLSEEALNERSSQVMAAVATLRHRSDTIAVLLPQDDPAIPILYADIETLYSWSTNTPYETVSGTGDLQLTVPLGKDVIHEARRLLSSPERSAVRDQQSNATAATTN